VSNCGVWRLGLALVALGAGCASSRPQMVDFSDATKTYRSEEYPEVFERWTRHYKLVQDIGTAMEVWATFLSWDFRQAYVAKYAKVYDLAPDEREQLAKAQRETARAVYEIHLVAQSTNDKWVDFERSSSPWRLTLIDGTGAELAPTSIKSERLPDIYENEFFPTRTPFSRTFTLRFVRPNRADETFVGPRSGSMTLRIASPVGRVEVRWDASTGSKSAGSSSNLGHD
jgi:hypothetical protein